MKWVVQRELEKLLGLVLGVGSLGVSILLVTLLSFGCVQQQELGKPAGQRAMAGMKFGKFTPEEFKRMMETTAEIRTKFGSIQLKFFPDVAPNHVNNFIELAKKGFYNGTTFHRIIPGFMIQGGDPNSKSADRSQHGYGGPGYTLKAEFSNKPHKRGTLSMVRMGDDPDSAGSQFFICVADKPGLNGRYTVFGEVISGMEVADRIVSQPRDKGDNPNERIEMTVTIIEK
jgi:peptidyl-prolyl cis-trans isomerase B (cyclophilin B)